jgi:hypothetical protein
MTAILSGTIVTAAPGIEPPTSAGLTLTADKSTASQGDNVTFTVGFNLLSGVISGYSTTQIAVLLPTGLDYVSSVTYVGGAPAVITTMPITSLAGTSVVVNFDNNTMTPGAAQLIINTRVNNSAGNLITTSAKLFLQQAGAAMPSNPNEQATVTTNINVTPTPITPQIFTVTFNLNGGIRVGGGALTQAVATGGSAVEPYVYRQGFTFNGWDTSFTNVQRNLMVTANWTADVTTGPITVDPPTNLIEGSFVNGQSTFVQSSHMPLIYYANLQAAYLANVQVDGTTLTAGTHYVATTGLTTGTTAIHLKASYLNTLTTGTHTLYVNFRNGAYANAQFTTTAYTNTFRDVTPSDWFYQGVGAMNASGLLQGVSTTQFDPYSNMTRGMVVTLLYRFAGSPSVAGFRNPFPDVAANQYYTSAVIWASANGIVTGYDTGAFAPNDMMTSEQFAAVLYRYQNALGTTPIDILMNRTYSDFNQISAYAQGAVNKLTMQGVFRDLPYDATNRFQPQTPVTRAQVATVMRLWIESIGW